MVAPHALSEGAPPSGVDVRRAGERDRGSLRAHAAQVGPVTDETLRYRIAFHLVG